MKKNLEAAFARPHSETDEFIHHAQAGMTLRDYFAAKAMQSFLDEVGSESDQRFYKDIAIGAYQVADAMLKAREA
jgi:hypothetical protein